MGYNTVIVIFGCAMLGVASGAVGCFALLRGRALMADAMGHAALPGVVLASLIGAALGTDPRALPPLQAGGALAGIAGLWCVQRLTATGRIRQDAAIALVLACFYAAGVVGLSITQAFPATAQAGLSHFILGQAAAMRAEDAIIAGSLALLCLGVTIALLPKLAALCFDADFAAFVGLNTRRIDAALLGLILAVCVAGLPAVGLVLVVAMLVLPAATARLLTTRLPAMFALSCTAGGTAGALGAMISAGHAGWPTGAAVVLTGTCLFAAAMLARRG